MQKSPFILALVLVGWTGAAHASVCVYPDDGNDFSVRSSDCPRIEWSLEEGRLSIPDRGELIWADEAGRVHYERSLAEVPEPYHSMYTQGRRDARGGLTFEEAHPLPPDGLDAASNTEQLVDSRAAWRSTTATWQTELYASLRALLQASMRPAPLALNPLLFAYPPGQSIVGGEQLQAVQDTRERALRARRMLLEELPRSARAHGLPLAWLRAQAVR